MKQELKDLRETFPATDAQIKDAARIVMYLAAGLFLLFGMLQAFTGDASAQQNGFEVVINTNKTVVESGDGINVSVSNLQGDGQFTEDESPLPKIALIRFNPGLQGTTPRLQCAFQPENVWDDMPGTNEIPPECELDVTQVPGEPTYWAHVDVTSDILEDTPTFNVVAYDYENSPGFLTQNRLDASYFTIENGEMNGAVNGEDSFMTASAFQFSGWDESNTMFLLIVLAMLTFSAYHGLVGCVFACVITVPVPIWNELSSSTFPWGFAAFALLYTVMLVIHIGYEYMGGLRHTSERGGMF